MSPVSNQMQRIFFYCATTVLALLSAFFVFYTSRLLYVTKMLTATRADGKGAYIGAIVFPLLSILFGWGAKRCLTIARRK